MRVASISGFTAYWGTDLPPNILELEHGKTVGGGEEAAIRTAVGLHERFGHQVDLWWPGQPGTWRGVRFHSAVDALYNSRAFRDADAVIGWSTALPQQYAKNAQVRIFAQQLNDLFAEGNWDHIDCIVSPSADHARQLKEWGWSRAHAVVHNGLDRELYADAPPWLERPLWVGYWSSPDRGLHHLLEAWPAVKQKVPQAQLHVFYEIDRYLKVSQFAIGPLGDRARYLEGLVARAKADPSIIFHGAVPRRELAKTQKLCRVQCYPYETPWYCEGFGGAVNQGIAAGCHVLLGPRDAFPSLYEDAVTWFDADISKMHHQVAPMVARALTDARWSEERVERAAKHRFTFTWDRATFEMNAVLLKQNWSLG